MQNISNMKKDATVKIVLDPQSKETFKSIKLRITFNRTWRVRAIPSDVRLSDVEFANEKLKKTKEAMCEARKCLAIAERICEELGASFTFTEFDIRYKKLVWEKDLKVDIDDWDTLLQFHFNKKKLKYSTMDNYRHAVQWIKSYHPDATVADITEGFVTEWFSFMRKTYKKQYGKNMSEATIGIYARAIKALYNDAVAKKIIIDTKPFAGKIEPYSARQKCLIKTQDWIRFISYEPKANTHLEFAHDFALLTFALCGANMVDILSLKNNNIENETISFVREKTERVSTIVKLPLCSAAKNIMEKHGTINPQKPNAYIFPFFTDEMTEKSRYFKRDSILKNVNSGIYDICVELGIEKFTTYQIRHTFAVLSRDLNGFSIEQISKLLGHKNVSTTQIYLNSITQELIAKTSNFIDGILG